MYVKRLLCDARPLGMIERLCLQSHDSFPRVGIRMYLRNALEFHLPNALICESDIPFAAAHEAAPMRKLCVLYLSSSRLQYCNTSFRDLVKYDLGIGEPSAEQNSGPGAFPLTEK